MPLTLASARPEIAKALGLCSSDTRVAGYVNTAIRRLAPKGLWVNTVVRYRICTNAGCLTWPRQIKTIEAAAVCNSPIKVRNQWFEFLGSGPGVLASTDRRLELVDRGRVCSFDDITQNSITSYIRVYADVAETGKYIILQGHDENGNWIRTQVSGEWIDGERVAIPTSPATPTTSTKKFSSLERVIKDATNGVVRLYEYASSAIVKSLAIYEPDETIPSYRRSYLPGVTNTAGTDCDKSSVTAMCKLAAIPVAEENDFLLIDNLDALVEACRGLRNLENKNIAEGMACMALAKSYLDDSLDEEEGTGAVMQLRVDNSCTFGAGSVENPL